VNWFFFVVRCHCPVYLLLLRRAFLFRHSGVCSLQSVPQTPNKAVSYRTEKGDTRTGLRCGLWPDARKRTDLHLSGNVQPHAGTVEGMRASSPFDIRVIRINTQLFCRFRIVQQLCIMQCAISEIMDFRDLRKPEFYSDQFPVPYLLRINLSIHSNLRIFSCKINLHKRCFVAQDFVLLQNIKSLSILTTFSQRSSGNFASSTPHGHYYWLPNTTKTHLEYATPINFHL
jgi:hypothetical protein